MHSTLKKHIMALSVFTMILLTVILSAVSISTLRSTVGTELEAFRKTLFEEKHRELKNYVDIILSEIAGHETREESMEFIRKLRYGADGYFWINDFNYFAVAHPDKNLNQTDLSVLQDANGLPMVRELVNQCKTKGEAVVVYKFNKLGQTEPVDKMIYAKVVGKNDWIVATGAYLDHVDIMVKAAQDRMKTEIRWMAWLCAAISLVMVAAISLLARRLVETDLDKPLREIMGVLGDFNNDLTVKIPEDFKYEFGELARLFNKLVRDLNALIAQVSRQTVQLNISVIDIQSSVEEQAAVSTEQSASVSEITSTMEEFSASSRAITAHCDSVVKLATKALEDTRNGAAAVETVIAKMGQIYEDNRGSIKEIVELGKKSREITKVMEIINNIADQTKLIAFNAALEASSAGEAGKRFGVVAAEIRRLADNVMESTGEIDERIREIQDAVSRLVIVSEKGSNRVEEGLDYSNQTALLLTEIVDGSHSTLNEAKQISLSTQQQETASDQVVTALREINEGSKHTSTSIIRISSTTNELKQMSDELKKLISRFKLNGDA